MMMMIFERVGLWDKHGGTEQTQHTGESTSPRKLFLMEKVTGRKRDREEGSERQRGEDSERQRGGRQ